MKLARKLTFALLLGMCAVLAVSGYSTWEREIKLFGEDMTRDHQAMGLALGRAIARIREISKVSRPLDFIDEANRQGGGAPVGIRWTWLDVPAGSAEGPRFDAASAGKLEELVQGRPVVIRARDPDGARQYTYVPVLLKGERPGAIELSESLSEEERYVRDTLLRTFLVTGAIVCICGVLAMALGAVLVGRPVGVLIAKARRVGAGDLSGRLELRQRDELSELAVELNGMCDRLADARARIDQETAARIATIEQLRHADRLMTVGKLASGLAHELGTPLNVVWAQAGMIVSGEVRGEETAESARVIAEQSQRMTGIIRQLLDFARPRTPRKTRVDLSDVARKTLELLTPMAENRGVRLELVDGAQVFAEVDAGQIQQVLSNLVVNGIQAMPQGGPLTVEVGRQAVKPPPEQGGPEADYPVLRVRDRGVGIPEENRTHLFEPFFTTKDVGEGTGLGLSISLGIVREHGGWIAVESQMGRGSLFSIYLPPGA